MAQDHPPPTFRYQQGQEVVWAGFSLARFEMTGRRWTERAMLAPVVEYRLRFTISDTEMPGWVDESARDPWPEDEP
jgi:hypothetical protein